MVTQEFVVARRQLANLRRLLAMCLLLLCFTAGHADFALTLKNEFVEKLCDTVAISANLLIDEWSPTHGISDDGDRHVICRSVDSGSNNIGLRVIAEIQNARRFPEAEQLVEASKGLVVPVEGIWRIWFEHPTAVMKQGNAVTEGARDSQDHVFEIHPVSRFDGMDLNESIGEIVDPNGNVFSPYTLEKAFFTGSQAWSKANITIKRTSATTKITCPKLVYNYIGGSFELLFRRASSSGDGTIAYVRYADDNGSVRLRFVTKAGTEADARINDLFAGESFYGLAMPRINLKWVSNQPEDGSSRSFQLSEYMGGFVELIGIYVRIGTEETASIYPWSQAITICGGTRG